MKTFSVSVDMEDAEYEAFLDRLNDGAPTKTDRLKYAQGRILDLIAANDENERAHVAGVDAQKAERAKLTAIGAAAKATKDEANPKPEPVDPGVIAAEPAVNK